MSASSRAVSSRGPLSSTGRPWTGSPLRRSRHPAPRRAAREAAAPAVARGLFWPNRQVSPATKFAAATQLPKAPPKAPLQSVYSTGKPLKLNLPKLCYAGPPQPGHAGEGGVGRAGALPPPPELSKSDEDFAQELGVQFVEGCEELSIDELNDLFELVGFPRRAPERLSLALQHTHRVLFIRCIRRSRQGRVGKLVGFARATSDGATTATIWDVAVNPAWQKSGMGTGLIERLLVGLVEDAIPTINLYAEPHVVKMYQRLGFVKDPEQGKGAVADDIGKELVGAAAGD